jgi:hypothetical protein
MSYSTPQKNTDDSKIQTWAQKEAQYPNFPRHHPLYWSCSMGSKKKMDDVTITSIKAVYNTLTKISDDFATDNMTGHVFLNHLLVALRQTANTVIFTKNNNIKTPSRNLIKMVAYLTKNIQVYQTAVLDSTQKITFTDCSPDHIVTKINNKNGFFIQVEDVQKTLAMAISEFKKKQSSPTVPRQTQTQKDKLVPSEITLHNEETYIADHCGISDTSDICHILQHAASATSVNRGEISGAFYEEVFYSYQYGNYIETPRGWFRVERPEGTTMEYVQHPLLDPAYANNTILERPPIRNVDYNATNVLEYTRETLYVADERLVYDRYFAGVPPVQQSDFVNVPPVLLVSNSHKPGMIFELCEYGVLQKYYKKGKPGGYRKVMIGP